MFAPENAPVALYVDAYYTEDWGMTNGSCDEKTGSRTEKEGSRKNKAYPLRLYQFKNNGISRSGRRINRIEYIKAKVNGSLPFLRVFKYLFIISLTLWIPGFRYVMMIYGDLT
jgi:hypothetical protein